MKKPLFITLLVIASFCSYAQDTVGLKLPVKEGKLVYEGIINNPNKSKMDLYNNAKQWFADYFKSSKYIIANDDKDQGEIIGVGTIFIYMKTLGVTHPYKDKLTIQIDVKDGKYRYRIYDMVATVPSVYTDMTGSSPGFDFTPEDLIGKLTGSGNATFTKNQCRKLLESINKETLSTIASLTTAMNAKADTF